MSLASLKREARAIVAEYVDAKAAVGRIAVRLGRVFAQAESLDADGLSDFVESVAPDLESGKRDEYLRGGRVVVALEGAGVDVGDVGIYTVTAMHKAMTGSVSAKQRETILPWLKSHRLTTTVGEDLNLGRLLYVWHVARGRKPYPAKPDVTRVLSDLEVFGSRGPQSGSDGAGNVSQSNRSRSTAPARTTETTETTETTPNLTEADLSALAREVGEVFGRVPSGIGRAAFGLQAIPLLRLCETYPATAVIALVTQQVKDAETAAKAAAAAKQKQQKQQKPQAAPAKRAPRKSRAKQQ